MPIMLYWDGLTRGHTKGKCILYLHIARMLRMLQRGAVLSVLPIYEYLCIMLPASAFESQLVTNTYIAFSCSVLLFREVRGRFLRNHATKKLAPNSRVVPASLSYA